MISRPIHSHKIHRAVLVSVCLLLAAAMVAPVAAATNDYIFVPTENGLLSRYRQNANGTLVAQGNLTLPVQANDTATLAGRGLIYVAQGRQGVDPVFQVQVYAVDFETGALTLLQTKDVNEEPSRIVVVDVGNADVIYLVSDDTLLLTAHVLNADGTIGNQLDQRDLQVDTTTATGAFVDLDVTADGRHLYATTEKYIVHYETTQTGIMLISSETLSPQGGLRNHVSFGIDNSTGKVWTTTKVSSTYRVDNYPTINGVPGAPMTHCCRNNGFGPVSIAVKDDHAYITNPQTLELDIYFDTGGSIVFEAAEFVGDSPLHLAIHPTDDFLWIAATSQDTVFSYRILPNGLVDSPVTAPGDGTAVDITLVGVPLIDCNGNGLHDPTEILGGLTDCNANGIPDECEPPPCPGIVGGDMDCSGTVTMIDLPDFVDALLAGTFTCNADTNGDFAVNGLDAQAFVTLLLP